MKHTKGPWRVTVEGYIASETHGFVPLKTPFRADAFTEGGARSDIPNEILDANARLIASAPEMLNALELAEATIMRLNRHNSADGTLDVIRSAIAKAKGER